MKDILLTLNDYSGAISAVACLVSTLALFFAISAWSQKHKTKVFGHISKINSNQTEMPYVQSLVLHNQKDKELAIHNIYIRFGRNTYLSLLGKGEEELNYVHILPSFGTLTFQLGPSYNYVEGTDVVDISRIMKEKYQIVLSTNEGKVNVETKSKYWSPIYASWAGNYYDRLVETWRADINTVSNNIDNFDRTIKYESYGDRMKYLVIISKDNKEIECPIFANQFARFGYFGNLPYTNEDLISETKLKKFLNKQKQLGNIQFDSIIRIIDSQAWFQNEWTRTNAENKMIIKPVSWFKYFFFGYIKNMWLNYVWHKKNA